MYNGFFDYLGSLINKILVNNYSGVIIKYIMLYIIML